jgi:hypothetical protein
VPLAAAAQTATQDEPPSRVRVTYRAPAECPDSSAFLGAVRERLEPGWEAEPNELASTLEVDVVRRDERFSATLRYRTAEDELFERAVEGSDCDEVVKGMALVTVLAIRARVGESAATESASPTPPASATTAKPKPSSVPPSPPPATARSEPPFPARVHLRLGLQAFVTSGVGPRAAYGPGAFVGAELGPIRMTLSGAAIGSGPVTSDGVPTAYGLLVGRLDGCPAGVSLGSHWVLEPCALVEAGAIRGFSYASPPRVTAPGDGRAPWVAVGGLGRVGFVAKPFIALVEGFARFPLIRERFYVSDGQDRDTVFEVPAAAFGGALSLGAQF